MLSLSFLCEANLAKSIHQVWLSEKNTEKLIIKNVNISQIIIWDDLSEFKKKMNEKIYVKINTEKSLKS